MWWPFENAFGLHRAVVRVLQAVAEPDETVANPRLDGGRGLVEEGRYFGVGVTVEVSESHLLQLELGKGLEASADSSAFLLLQERVGGLVVADLVVHCPCVAAPV